MTAWEHWVLLAFLYTVEGCGFKSRPRHVKKLLFGRVWGILNTFKHVRVCNMNLDDRLELTESVDPPSVRWKKSRKIWIVPRGPVAQDERLVPVW